MFTWIIALLALVGTYLNVKMKRSGFLLWMVTNFYLSMHNFYNDDYAQSFLFLVYFGLAIWGYFSWKK